MRLFEIIFVNFVKIYVMKKNFIFSLIVGTCIGSGIIFGDKYDILVLTLPMAIILSSVIWVIAYFEDLKNYNK